MPTQLKRAQAEKWCRLFVTAARQILGSFSDDSNENVKTAIGLLSKTKRLHVHHGFCTFLCRYCTTTT